MQKNMNKTMLNYSSLNITAPYSPRYAVPVSIIIFLLILIFIINLVGNSVAALVIVRKRKMRTFTNSLILNLAVADLLVALICIPLEIPLELNDYKWIYGKLFCKIFYPLQSAAVFASASTLEVLSVSRYWAIIHPFRKQPNILVAKMLIPIIWLSSVLLVIPFVLGLAYVAEHESCMEIWDTSARQTYTIAAFVLQCAIPLFLITVASSRIVYEMAYKQSLSYRDRKREEESNKLAKLLVAVSVTFAICCTPTHIITILVQFENGHELKYIEEITIAAYILLYSNSALNPILYNIFSSNFRNGLIEIFQEVFKHRRKRLSRNTGTTNTLISRVDITSLKRKNKAGRRSKENGELIQLKDIE